MLAKLNIFSYVPKSVLIVVGALIAVASTGVALASWSPERPTFTMENPAPYVTFNSITDNPTYGDERPFHDTKKAGTPNGTPYSDNYEVSDGEELVLRAYVHNNAAANLNASGKGVAKNTKIRFLIPTGTSTNLRTISYISADNAQPKTVSDTVDYYANQPFSLEYVPGSAVQYTNSNYDGIPLSDSIVTQGGTPIGDTTPNGDYRGCSEFVSTVHIKVKVKMSDYSLEKTVRLDGEDRDDWREMAHAKPGETVEWKLNFTNTGSSVLNDVVIGDKLPAGMQYVPGSTMIYNGNHPNGIPAGTDNIVSGGIDIGAYNPNSNAIVVFKAKVPSVDELKCGMNHLVNTGYARPGQMGTINDDASVKVNRDCKKGFAECTNLTLDILDKEKRTVKATATVEQEHATITGYQFNWGDGNVTESDSNMAQHSYAKAGKYTVTAVVSYTIDGADGESGRTECSAMIDFKKPNVPVNPVKPVTPVQPQVLPVTGPAEILASLFGTGSLAGATHMWVNSRRALKSGLKG